MIDLTIVAADGPETDRAITDHLVRLDHPHLRRPLARRRRLRRSPGAARADLLPALPLT